MPFILVIALVSTRLSIFDGWDIDWTLVALAGILLAGTFVEVLRLRQEAAALKATLVTVVSKLSRQVLERGSGGQDLKGRMDYYLGRIEKESRGSLRPLLEDPILRAAIALPTGGTGALLLLENLFGKL